MKTISLIGILIVGSAVAAAPAVAKTSLSKGKQVCEAAAKAQTPAPKGVRTDNDATKVSDTTLTYKLNVRNADDSQAVWTCKVDRATDAATISAQ
jgi:hypothetical protein